MKLPFVGPSYVYRSLNFDCQRSINLYPVKGESPYAKSIQGLAGTPGKLAFATMDTSRCRCAWEVNDRAFWVYGDSVYEVFSDGTKTKLGILSNDAGLVSMSDNGFQVCIVNGANGYLIVFADNLNIVLNGTFDSDTIWTKGAGWTIAAGVAAAAGALNTAISETPATLLKPGVSYSVTYTITRSAGSIAPSLGGTAGVSRSASGTYTETIVAGSSNALIAFTGTGFTGTLDNVSVKTTVDSFITITNVYFLGADTVTYCDGYFIFNKPDTGEYYLSALNDGSTGDPLDISTAEALTDNLICVKTVHKEIWLLGEKSVQVAADTGNLDFPFQSRQDVLIEYGTTSPASVATTANTIFWLGHSKDGEGTIWMATGYQPQRISTYAIEYQLQQKTQAEREAATAYTYQEDGHYFYIINVGSLSFAYDIGLSEWHERAFWNTDTGAYERDRAEFHMYCFGKHLVGDYNSNVIYEQSLNLDDDNGEEIRCLRTAPHFSDDLELLYFSNFQLDMETGIGQQTGGAQDTNPQVILQWSDDGGHTWSGEKIREAGKIGKYKARARWNQLGRSRDRVFRTIMTFKGRKMIIGARVDVEKGSS